MMSETVSITLSISPSSGTPTESTFAVSLAYSFTGSGTSPSGTMNLLINALVIASQDISALPSGFPRVSLSSPATPGPYSVQVHYVGDGTYSAADSNVATYTVTGDVPPPTPSTALQAIAKPIYQGVVVGERTRTQIENGEEVTVVFHVSGINVLAAGESYDEFSVATLTGGGVREDLTIIRDGGGHITSITGSNPSTAWPSPPKVTITRWTSGGTYIPG